MARTGSIHPSVTGLGAVTSVGREVVGACAALRAGISRPRELSWFSLLDEHAHVESAVVGHPVDGFTEGFAITGAWIRLALGALDDLVSYAALPGPEDEAFWRATGLFVGAPEMPAARFGEGGDDIAALSDAYLERVVALWRRPLDRSALRIVPGGNASAMFALQAAAAVLAEGTVERVIVLCADSYVDHFSVSWLAEQRRLKGPDQPTGLAPGEGAACVLVEAPNVAERRGGRVEGVLRGVATGREAKAFVSGELSLGDALGRALRECLAQARLPPPFRGAVIADLNGESWRAQELNGALTALADVVRPASQVYPASSCGDTGAASGPLGLCAAVRALARGYAAGEVLVVSSSAEGPVGVACIGEGASQPRGRRFDV
jgi:3-oxoacyl-[acyl-carrier-protein] synthase-1